MKRLSLLSFLLWGLGFSTRAQEYFDIRNFDIEVNVNQDATIDIKEKISVHFFEPRHGIFRRIPYKYKLSDLPEGTQRAEIPWKKDGYRYTKIENISVSRFGWEVYYEGNYRVIKIGSADKYVNGDQVYEIRYTLVGAMNFFSDFSELYLNLTGNEWPVPIEKVHFRVHFYKPLVSTSDWFVATGATGSKENFSQTKWLDNSVLEGDLTKSLNPYEGVTIGVRMPAGYLVKPDYKMMGKEWLLLPLIIFLIMYFVWKKWGKDLPVTVTTEFYPPEGISPSVAGYIIDSRLNRHDLTALIPYWGAGGYLQVEEIQKKKLLGLINQTEFKFIKLKDIPASANEFEKTMFNGLFSDGPEVMLDDLKNNFYSTMNVAKGELQSEIKREEYYVKYTRTFSAILPIAGLVVLILSIVNFISDYPLDIIYWLAMIASSLIVIIFGSLMEKKTEKGTELYQRLLGFKEFIKSVEKDRLQEFLKQDENYFDKVLPFAIVFNVADKWKDKLKGLDVPPPSWYSGYYSGNTFNTMSFMDNLDKGMSAMSNTFFSTPPSSGSSFGGGGSSGGGSGGGGGGSW